MKKNKPRISVVIPSYNSEQHIEKCLGSLIQQQTNMPYEIIVVDSSADATPKIIAEKYPSVKLIHLEQQTYPGAGRNIGVAQAQGEIIAFIDSDCVAAENWLQTAADAIAVGYHFVGGGVKNGNPETSISKADFWLTFNEFMSSMPRREVKFMPTCNFVCTKTAFTDIGGFDSALLAGEDTLFCFKAAQKYPLLFKPDLAVAHSNRTALKPFLRHHYSFGKHSAYLRKNFELPGNKLSKYAILSPLAPPVKYVRITLRMLRWNRGSFLSYLFLTPLVLLGIGAWGRGFVEEGWRR